MTNNYTKNVLFVMYYVQFNSLLLQKGVLFSVELTISGY